MATLNNSVAYGFCKNIVCNVIIKTLATKNIKAKAVLSKGASAFTTIEVSIPKIGKVACLAGNVKDNTLALSMHHMLNCKNIAFIYNGKIYIVSQFALQSNWNNLIVKNVYTYKDGLGVRTSMTPANINILIDIATTSYDIPADILSYYTNKRLEYFKN